MRSKNENHRLSTLSQGNAAPGEAVGVDGVIAELRPYIQGHGGDVFFVKFEDGIVYVRLTGACQTCPFSLFTLKMGLEERIKEKLPEVQAVELVE